MSFFVHSSFVSGATGAATQTGTNQKPPVKANEK